MFPNKKRAMSDVLYHAGLPVISSDITYRLSSDSQNEYSSPSVPRRSQRYVRIRHDRIIGNIFKKHILNAPARSLAILLIVKYTQIHQLSLPEILDADILEPYIPDQIIITCIDSQTA